MEIYKNSLMDMLYYHDKAFTDVECSVSITNGIIKVSYIGEKGNKISYIGSETSPGHFQLKGDDGEDSRATLHRFPGTKVFVGKRKYNNYRGLWHITLSR